MARQAGQGGLGHGRVRPGRQVWAWLCVARYGKAWQGRRGRERRGTAGQVSAWLGVAGRGVARQILE